LKAANTLIKMKKSLDTFEYDEEKILGQGAFGKVYKGCKKDDPQKLVAVKEMYLTGITEEAIKTEAKVLKSLNSVNVVRFYDGLKVFLPFLSEKNINKRLFR
jgi:serine/threonine protein kinase